MTETDTVPADAVLADAVLADAVLADAVLADTGLADAVLADTGPTEGSVSAGLLVAVGPTRRQVLLTTGVVVAAAAATAACGSSAPATPASTGPVSVPAADVPVGGGMILTDRQVVVTQPTAGQFKAFSTVCPHQGCLVTSASAGTINCPCHNSNFSTADGSVQSGPSPAPLASVPVTVSGSTITVS